MPSGRYKEAQCNQRANTLHLGLDAQTSRARAALSERLWLCDLPQRDTWRSPSQVQSGRHLDSAPSWSPVGELTFSLVKSSHTLLFSLLYTFFRLFLQTDALFHSCKCFSNQNETTTLLYIQCYTLTLIYIVTKTKVIQVEALKMVWKHKRTLIHRATRT